nr:nitroreductase family protein [Micromonospora sp. DSM 115978]
TTTAINAGKATRSPALIAVVVSRVPGSKVPRAEQDASAAAAAQNICHAAHALGLGSAWKSVPMSDSDEVRAAFGMTGGEDLVGWVELGQVGTDKPLPPRPEVALSSVATELTDRGLVAFSDRPATGPSDQDVVSGAPGR